MANFDFQDEFPKNSENEWDIGWDEFWDQNSDFKDLLQENSNLNDALKPFKEKKTPHKKFKNALEEALDEDLESDFTPDLKWGIIDDTKPTKLNDRLKTFLSAPFTAVLEPKKINTPSQKMIGLKKKTEGIENKKSKPKIQIRPPKIHSTIGESHGRSDNIIIETSDLSFNNINNVSPDELNDIDNLLEGSLGKKNFVKFDNEIVQDKNINFVAQEKILRKQEKAKKLKPEKTEEQLLSAEATIASELNPADTLAPGLTDIRFDLKSAQETSSLFNKNEIDEILNQIPAGKGKIQKEQRLLEKTKEELESDIIGATLFSDNINALKENESLVSKDNLLDSLLDEVDGEATENKLENAEFKESFEESLGKDEIITQENIIDDSSDMALEFMDSAAQEAESLFEDFFKKGTAVNETDKEAKVGYLDIIKLKIKELKDLYNLWVKFIKDPKYFIRYYKISSKDIFIAIGLIFTLITYTGLIHLQFITEKFPMNLF